MNMDDEDWNKYHFVQGGFVSGLVTTRQAGLDWEVESGAVRLGEGVRWSARGNSSKPVTNTLPSQTLNPPPSAHVSTWLILPVVICLSQRLSHACPSINYLLYGETADGSLNQL